MSHFKFEHQKIEVGQTPTGEKHFINVIDLISNENGPFVYIQSSVHGAELQGNMVIQKLIEHFQANPFKGRLRFVPLANPEATNHKMGQYTYGRFNPQTGHNWNRNYIDIFSQTNQKKTGLELSSFLDNLLKNNASLTYDQLISEMKKFLLKALEKYAQFDSSYGSPAQNGKLNLELQKLASQADIVLDFHTGPIATRYIYCPEYAFDRALAFGFPHYLVIPHEFAGAMDEACFSPWVYLDDYIKSYHPSAYKSLTAGRENLIHTQSFTLEFGSEEFISSIDAIKDRALVLNYLKTQGICEAWSDKSETPEIAWCPLENFKTYYSVGGGLCDYHLRPGDRFDKNDKLYTLYHLNNDYSNSPLPFRTQTVEANESGIVINHSTSSAVTLGAEVYQVMENPRFI